MSDIRYTSMKGTWDEVADSARTTIGLDPIARTCGLPNKWKKQILLAEHSPIRQIAFRWTWMNLKYFVSVHFVRHWLGILHWVSTSRTDRTGVNRDKLPQDTEVKHACEANVQALINISRKRLCSQASKETREAWKAVVAKIGTVEKEIHEVLVPECIYRGFCPEFKSCGYVDTPAYEKALQKYRSVI